MVGLVKKTIIFAADMSSSVHVDNKKERYLDSLRPRKWFRWYYLRYRQRIFYKFYKAAEEILFNWFYDGMKSYIFVNAAEIYKFKAKESEVNAFPLCLGDTFRNFSVNSIKKTGLYKHF